MKKIKQALSIAGYNFRLWRGNPRILVTFALSFVLCFLLSDKAVQFAMDHNTTMQLVETFIWSFGDSNSILLSSVLLVLLFADMPFLSSGTPLYLVRTDRRTWITGQVIYIISATTIYMLFVLMSTVLLSAKQAFPANMWSPTAAILGYTNAGPGAGKDPGNELALSMYDFHFLSHAGLHRGDGDDHAGVQSAVRTGRRRGGSAGIQRLWHPPAARYHPTSAQAAG